MGPDAKLFFCMYITSNVRGRHAYSQMLPCCMQYLENGELENVRSVEQRPISLEEAQAADEVFLCSSSLSVVPVIIWDGARINEGLSGLVTMSLRAMIIRHMNPQYSLGEHLEVPYGFLTGMS